MLASLAFVVKKRQMPVCDFVITDEHILRTTKQGALSVPWSEIQTVYRYSQGYLVEKEKGALPLPYRSFSAPQLAEFERLIEQHAAAHSS